METAISTTATLEGGRRGEWRRPTKHGTQGKSEARAALAAFGRRFSRPLGASTLPPHPVLFSHWLRLLGSPCRCSLRESQSGDPTGQLLASGETVCPAPAIGDKPSSTDCPATS